MLYHPTAMMILVHIIFLHHIKHNTSENVCLNQSTPPITITEFIQWNITCPNYMQRPTRNKKPSNKRLLRNRNNITKKFQPSSSLLRLYNKVQATVVWMCRTTIAIFSAKSEIKAYNSGSWRHHIHAHHDLCVRVHASLRMYIYDIRT